MPDPVPAVAVLSVGSELKVAVTVVVADNVKEQFPVPEQPLALPVPLQPAKEEPVLGAAIQLTDVPEP